MLQTIINAVNDREMLSLAYGSLIHTVEPYAVGVSVATGTPVLWCFQLHAEPLAVSQCGMPKAMAVNYIGQGYEWDVFEVAQISRLHALGRYFVNERHGYMRNNKHMSAILAQL